MPTAEFKNPFRPGAGHMPPYLAGRQEEQKEFDRLLDQEVILRNMVLTGLRGVGKTVLLDALKPIGIKKDWLWVGTDLSESTSVSEANVAMRLLTDLSVVTSALVISQTDRLALGFSPDARPIPKTLDYPALARIYDATPGLVADKLKRVLETVWAHIEIERKLGIVFAYDEAQNLADYPAKDQYPLSLLLDVFQSVQRKGMRFMLVLTGLPTLFPKLVEARTYAERMFRVVFLTKLSADDSKDAILKPIQDSDCPVRISPESVDLIRDESDGYPYFIQFICTEVYDLFIHQTTAGQDIGVPMHAITRKLDSDFFAGRWARATDRQRDLLVVIAFLDKQEDEFTFQQIVSKSATMLTKPFGASHANQMLASLCDAGLTYRNRHGKYSFAVPLFDKFIARQAKPVPAAAAGMEYFTFPSHYQWSTNPEALWFPGPTTVQLPLNWQTQQPGTTAVRLPTPPPQRRPPQGARRRVRRKRRTH